MELNFDSTKVEKVESKFDPIPDGKYKAMIVNSEERTTQVEGNRYLSLTWQIVDGPYKGRTIFDNFHTVRNGKTPTDAETIRIANSRLADVCGAVNVIRFKNTSELHNKIICISVRVKAPNNGYPASNKIVKYESINGGSKLPIAEPETKAGSSLPWG